MVAGSIWFGLITSIFQRIGDGYCLRHLFINVVGKEEMLLIRFSPFIIMFPTLLHSNAIILAALNFSSANALDLDWSKLLSSKE